MLPSQPNSADIAKKIRTKNRLHNPEKPQSPLSFFNLSPSSLPCGLALSGLLPATITTASSPGQV